MSEKVLGIKKSIVKSSLWLDLAEEKGYLVPIRLASESVGLEWLREEIERFYFNNPEMEGVNMALKHLLSIAEKEAKKRWVKKKKVGCQDSVLCLMVLWLL